MMGGSSCSDGYYTTAGSSIFINQSPRTCQPVVDPNAFGTARYARTPARTRARTDFTHAANAPHVVDARSLWQVAAAGKKDGAVLR